MAYDPTSGYLSLSSFHTSSGAFGTICGRVAIQQFFVPFEVGTVTHVGLMLYRFGSPTYVQTFTIVEINSGAGSNPSPPPVTTNSGYVLKTHFQVITSSIEVGSRLASSWYWFPVDTPFFMSNDQQQGNSAVRRYAAPGYFISTKSDATNPTSANHIGWVSHADDNSAVPGNSSASFRSNGGIYGDMGYAVRGFIQTHTLWMDKPMGLYANSGDVVDNVTTQNITGNRIGGKFFAVGSKVTRFLAEIIMDGAATTSLQPSLWSHNVSSNLPDTCIGSGVVVRQGTSNSDDGVNDSYGGDWGDISNPMIFVFSGGIDVTSGNAYWVALEAYSFSTFTSGTLNRGWVKRNSTYNPNSLRLFRWATEAHGTAGGAIGGNGSDVPLMEVWYQDSLTVYQSSAAIGGGGGGPAGPTGPSFRRAYPQPVLRVYPSVSLREYPKP